MYIHKVINGFVLNFEGYFDEGKLVKTDKANTAVRITLQDIHDVWSQFEEVGNSSPDEISVRIGRYTYDLCRDDAKELMHLVSMVQFDEEPLPIQHTWPEEFWTEEYLLSL